MGYVLRRILIRSSRHGYKMGSTKPFLNELLKVLVELMQVSYPALTEKNEFITKTIKDEEVKFF